MISDFIKATIKPRQILCVFKSPLWYKELFQYILKLFPDKVDRYHFGKKSGDIILIDGTSYLFIPYGLVRGHKSDFVIMEGSTGADLYDDSYLISSCVPPKILHCDIEDIQNSYE